MKKVITGGLIFIITIMIANFSMAIDAKKTIIGEWKVVKILRKGKAISKKDPMASFTKTTIEFFKDKKVLIKAGKSSLPGVWELKGNKLKFFGNKYGLVVAFQSKNRMTVQYTKDNVKIYLKRKS